MTSADGVMVRDAVDGDRARIVEIYNHYIEHTAITFDLAPYTVEERAGWFAPFAASGSHRLFVAEESGVVLGYAGSHQFRPKAAYDTTVETTIYLAPDACGRGIGGMLYTHLFGALAGEDLRTAIAGITLPNEASVALHARFGFRQCGMMREVGRKFGRYWDVGWFERTLEVRG